MLIHHPRDASPAASQALLDAGWSTAEIVTLSVAGLPRAERELTAAAASRANSCIFCASVHARFASTYSKRRQDVQRLLVQGVEVDIDQRWNEVIAASVALTETPASFDTQHVERLREIGLDDFAILDLIYSAAFFNWANRLMLSVGEPTPAVKS